MTKMISVQEHLADQMTRAQAMRLRRLSHEAYQPRQFEENLTQADALRNRGPGKGNRAGGLVLTRVLMGARPRPPGRRCCNKSVAQQN
jgi:hypothetical protein